jgi:hypothetical protein
MSERTKDVMITPHNTKRGKTKAGDKDVFEVSLRPEQVNTLIAELQSKTSERGAKLSFYTSKKASQDGREFDSTFGFVQAIQEFGAQAPRRFNAKAPTKDDVAAKVASIKAAQIKG